MISTRLDVGLYTNLHPQILVATQVQYPSWYTGARYTPKEPQFPIPCGLFLGFSSVHCMRCLLTEYQQVACGDTDKFDETS